MLKIIVENRNFTYLLIGQLISHVGDAIYIIALPWLLLNITGSTIITSFITISGYLPAILFGLFAGSVIDRYDYRKIMIYSDIARAMMTINAVKGVEIGSGFNSVFETGSSSLDEMGIHNNKPVFFSNNNFITYGIIN